MKPIKVNGFTNVMKAPENWRYPSTPVDDLYTRAVIKQPDNVPTVTSAWMPTEAELEQLKNGCPVLLTIITTQPLHPMQITVGTVLNIDPAIGLPGGPALRKKLN